MLGFVYDTKRLHPSFIYNVGEEAIFINGTYELLATFFSPESQIIGVCLKLKVRGRDLTLFHASRCYSVFHLPSEHWLLLACG